MAVDDDSDFGSEWIGDMFLQEDNMDAIHDYMSRTKAITPKAKELQMKFLVWWNSMTWYGKYVESDSFNVARNKKLEFNFANAVTKQEQQAVKDQAENGLTYEETIGKPRANNTSGKYVTDADVEAAEREAERAERKIQREIDEEDEPFFPLRVKVAAGAVLAAIAGLWVVKTIYLNPILNVAGIATGRK